MSTDATKAAPKPTPKARPSTTKKKQDNQSPSWLALLAVIIAIVACIAAAYLFYQNQQNQLQSSNLQATVATVKAQMQSAQTSASAFQQKVLATQAQESAQLKKALLQMNQDQNNAAKTITLGSAVYLARLANLAIIIDHDPKLAAHLLQMTQLRLKAVPAFSDLRASVINYRTQLLAVPAVDLDGLLMQLGSLKKAIIVISAMPKPALNVTTGEAQTHPVHLTANWKTLWAYLKQFFVITHHDDAHATLPSLTHIQSVKDSTYLALSTAQWAVLHQQPAIYKHALTAAQQQLKTIAQMQPNKMKALLGSIVTLENTNINPSYPKLGNLVDQLTQAQTNLSHNASQTTSGNHKTVSKRQVKNSSKATTASPSKSTMSTKQKVTQGVEA